MSNRSILGALILAGTLVSTGTPSAAQEVSIQLNRRIGNAQLGLSYRFGSSPRSRISHSSNHSLRAVHHGGGRHWIPGYYDTLDQRVWVRAGWESSWVEPVYRTQYDSCGQASRVLIRGGRWERVYRKGRYEIRRVRIRRPGYWSSSPGRRRAY